MKKSLKLIAFILSIAFLFGVLALAIHASEASENFIETVEAMKAASSLDAKDELLLYAEEYLDEYLSEGGSTEDEQIAEYYLDYLTLKEEIDAEVALCIEFIDYVEAAENALGYPALKANMIAAEELLSKIDNSYSQVSGFVNSFNTMKFDLAQNEKVCEYYIEAGEQAKAAKTYAEAKAAVEYGSIVEKNIEIFDYPGLEEARAALTDASELMSTLALEAAEFILAVSNIGKIGSIPEGVIAAYAVYETIDPTAPDVSASLDKLRSIERNYNKSATEANATVDDINGFIFGFGF